MRYLTRTSRVLDFLEFSCQKNKKIGIKVLVRNYIYFGKSG